MKLFRTKFFIAFCLSFIPIILFAQWENKPLMPFEQDGLWGYINKERNIIVDARFQEAYPLNYGRGRIKYKGKYGFINKYGEIVIKAKYKEAKDFSLNGAEVKKGKKEFRIDTLGNVNNVWIMTCGYSQECNKPTQLTPHKIIKKNNLFGLQLINEVKQSNGQTVRVLDTINIEFDSIFPLYKNMICFKKNDKFGIIDESWFSMGAKKTIEMLEIEFENISVFSCEERPQEFSNIIALKKNGKWGVVYLSYNGWFGVRYMTEEIKFRYKKIVSIENNFLIVEYKDNKFGFIDVLGNEYFKDD